MGSAAQPKTAENQSPVALTVQGAKVSYNGIHATFGAGGLAVVIDDLSNLTVNGQRVSFLPAEAANGNVPGAKRYNSIAEEVKARNLKEGDALEDGWVYDGISKSTGTAFAHAPGLAFNGAEVTWHQTVEYKPDRVTFGYKDSIQRKAEDVNNPQKDDGLASVPTAEELPQLYAIPAANKAVGSRWCWSGSSYSLYAAPVQHFGDGGMLNFAKVWTGPVALLVRRDPRSAR